jgi:hypothetical protein
MTTDLAIRETAPATVRLSSEQLQYIAGTEFVPQGLRNNLPAIMACVATGRALGIDDMSSLRLIHVVNGRPTFSAELMVQIVRRHGHSISGQTKDGSCTVVGKRADNGDTMEVTWTLEMAQRAGLAGKQVWKQYPEALLWARAVSQLCRQLFPDCFAGATYTPEEIPASDFELEPLGDATLDELADVTPSVASTVEDGPRTAPVASLSDDLSSPAQKTKLNILVAKLVEGEHITKTQLWQAMDLDPQLGLGEDGAVHWSPLRDHLSKAQASALIERLSKLDAKVAAGAEA